MILAFIRSIIVDTELTDDVVHQQIKGSKKRTMQPGYGKRSHQSSTVKIKKTLLATLLVAQMMALSHANAAEADGDFGAYDNADWQTRFLACESAIYERDWYIYEHGILKKGGLDTQQAEAAYEAMRESSTRMLFFHALGQDVDRDAYSGKRKQVEETMFAMYEKDKDSAVQEYKRLGDYCLFRVYPSVIAYSAKFSEVDKLVRSLPAPEDLMKSAKAEFMERAMKAASK